MKLRRWKFGPTEIDLATDLLHRRPDDTGLEAFRRPPGSLRASSVTSVLPAKPEKPTGQPSATFWSQPLHRKIVALAVGVSFAWLRWGGLSDWLWLIPLLAILTALVYTTVLRRAVDAEADPEAPHELPPLPAKYRHD